MTNPKEPEIDAIDVLLDMLESLTEFTCPRCLKLAGTPAEAIGEER